MKNPSPVLSIGIVNWNTKDLLFKLLSQLRDDVSSLSREIIVVDNASSDGSADVVKEYFPEVVLIENKKNLGFTKACNQIIRRMRGEFLLLLNTDLTIEKGGIDDLVEFIREKEDVALCGPRLVYPDGRLQASVRSFHTLWTVFTEITGLSRLFPRNRAFGKYLLSYWDHSDIREVDFVSGAAYLMRASVLKEIGPFDEDYFLYVQDADWSYRVKKKGWKVFYCPDVTFVHMEGETVKKISAIKDFLSHYERLIFFRKHYGIGKAWLLYNMTIKFACLKFFVARLWDILRNKKRTRSMRWIFLYRKFGRALLSRERIVTLPEIAEKSRHGGDVLGFLISYFTEENESNRN